MVTRGLLFNDDRIEVIRRRVTEPRYSALWNRVVSQAHRMVEANRLELPEDTFTVYYYVRQRLMDLAMTALVTEDVRYADTLAVFLRDLAGRDLDFWIGPPYPNRPRHQVYRGEMISTGELETATLATGMTLALDWVGEMLDPETREITRRCLKEKAYPLLRNSTLFQSEKWVMNHLCVIASAFALVVLMLEDASSSGIGIEGDLALIQGALGSWMRTLDADGSYGEGFHYWAYPVNCLFFALAALKHTRGILIRESECLRPCFRWAIYNQVGRYPRAGYEHPVATAVNTYDSPLLFQMEAPETLLYARLFQDPLANWYIREFLLTPLSRPDALHTVWHTADSLLLALDNPDAPAASPEELCLPRSRVFHDTGFVYLRDGWSRVTSSAGDDVFCLLSGGGGRANSHQHFDKNSFSLFARGEYWIVDPGHSCYRGVSHHDYDPRTRSHNTLCFDGQDQALGFVERGMSPEERKPVISHHNRAEVVCARHYAELDYVESDARQCYEPYLTAFSRRVWHIHPDSDRTGYTLMWDRIDAGDHPGAITIGFNLNNRDGKLSLALDGGTVRASRPRSDLGIRAVFPEAMSFDRSDDARLHHAYHILPDRPVEGAPGTAVRLSYRILADTRRVDLVTLFVPLAGGSDLPAIAAEHDGPGPVLGELKLAVGQDRFVLGPRSSVTIGRVAYRF